VRVRVTRSGGFAGLTETIADVDSAKLDAAAGRRLAAAVDAAPFEAAAAADDAPGADVFRYEIVVEDARGRRAAAFGEGGRTAARFASLIELLQRLR
jgi:hypothetical protein